MLSLESLSSLYLVLSMCKTLWWLVIILSGDIYLAVPLLALTSLCSFHFFTGPLLTVLSTQATERPAKRLATPRATLTSSLRMSSHRLFRNLNNLSVYVATPGDRRKGGLVNSGWGSGSDFWVCPLAPATRCLGPRWMGRQQKGGSQAVETPLCLGYSCFQL